jgi:hypothetical protein
MANLVPFVEPIGAGTNNAGTNKKRPLQNEVVVFFSGQARTLLPEYFLLFGGADLEHLGATHGANAFLSGLAVLHRDRLHIFGLALFLALHTISFHGMAPVK